MQTGDLGALAKVQNSRFLGRDAVVMAAGVMAHEYQHGGYKKNVVEVGGIEQRWEREEIYLLSSIVTYFLVCWLGDLIYTEAHIMWMQKHLNRVGR
ncbi:MAG: hypothetical protein PHS44_00360 [Candidatus Dojkabacteria bacterium]|nr:hypothetical protein [Candidatus Dojkabacteria bacterium]